MRRGGVFIVSAGLAACGLVLDLRDGVSDEYAPDGGATSSGTTGSLTDLDAATVPIVDAGDAAAATPACNALDCCVIDVAAGSDDGVTTPMCALLHDGSVYCWGSNTFGVMGMGTMDENAHPTPTRVEGLPPLVEISVSSTRGCGRTAGNEIWCWGTETTFNFGTTDPIALKKPTKLPITSPSYAPAYAWTCYLTDDAGVECFGFNKYGELDGEPDATTVTPVRVTLPPTDRIVAAGHATCARGQADGLLRCWGLNTGGVLGQPGVTSNTTGQPNLVANLPPVGHFDKSVATACADVDGGVRCWGSSNRGRLGNGKDSTEQPPLPVISDRALHGVTTGILHTCAIGDDELLYCWGNSDLGRLGPYETDKLTATQVPNFSGAKKLALGFDTTCALLKTGEIKCVGANQKGQLGNGVVDLGQNDAGIPFRSVPVTVTLPCPAAKTNP